MAQSSDTRVETGWAIAVPSIRDLLEDMLVFSCGMDCEEESVKPLQSSSSVCSAKRGKVKERPRGRTPATAVT